MLLRTLPESGRQKRGVTHLHTSMLTRACSTMFAAWKGIGSSPRLLDASSVGPLAFLDGVSLDSNHARKPADSRPWLNHTSP